jgi:hypothetical protein
VVAEVAVTAWVVSKLIVVVTLGLPPAGKVVDIGEQVAALHGVIENDCAADAIAGVASGSAAVAAVAAMPMTARRSKDLKDNRYLSHIWVFMRGPPLIPGAHHARPRKKKERGVHRQREVARVAS